MSIEKESKFEFKEKISINKKLASYSWFNLGGSADLFFNPDNADQLSLFLKNNTKKITVLGAGSNTLIRDGGIKGITIKLSSKFSYVKLIDNNIIEVGAATFDKKVSDFALEKSLTGFEFLSCIPGSIGGGIKMNTGCYGEDISKILISIEAIDSKGHIKEINTKNINFFYRGTDLPDDLIILSAKFKGLPSKKEEIMKKQSKLISKKKKSQPSQIKTCGSTFKNPINKKAWELIKKSKCINMSVGKAKISDKHCNFFVNEGGATSSDIEELIKKVRETVYKKTGEKLELEIKIVGSN
jgi:UDP-N-acetylmuramate dehydrogenase